MLVEVREWKVRKKGPRRAHILLESAPEETCELLIRTLARWWGWRAVGALLKRSAGREDVSVPGSSRLPGARIAGAHLRFPVQLSLQHSPVGSVPGGIWAG